MTIRPAIRWTLVILLLMGVLITSAGVALLNSQAGARWAWSRVEQASEGHLSLGALQGTLADGLTLEQFRLEAPGLRVQSDRARLSLDLNWTPLRLVIPSLEVETLQVDILEPPDEQDAEVLAKEATALPLEVLLSHARVQELIIRNSSGASMLEPLQLEFSAIISEQLTVSRLSARGASLAADLAGEVTLREPFQHRLESQLKLPDSWAEAIGLESPQIELHASGDDSLSKLRLADRTGQLNALVDVRDWLVAPAWDMTLDGSELALPASSTESVHIKTVNLHAQGNTKHYEFDGKGTAIVAALPTVEVEFEGSGDGSGLQLDRAQLESEFLDLGLSGSVQWQPELEISLATNIIRLEPQPWVADWPEDFPVKGGLALSWRPGVLEAHDLLLEITGKPATLAGNLSWRTDVSAVQGELVWSNVHWPLESQAPGLGSRSGHVKVRGKPDDWQIEGQIDLQSGDYPPGKVWLAGGGDLSQARFDVERAEMLGGAVTGTASMNWRENLNWQAELDTRQIELAQLWPQWPAVVNASLSLEGTPAAETFRVEVRRLDGTYDGQPLKGSGKMLFRSGLPEFRAVSLKAPGTALELDGRMASPAGLRFTVEAERPGLLAQLLGAEIEGSGTLSTGGGVSPWAELDLQIHQLRQATGQVESLSLRGDAGPDRPNAQLVAELEGLQVADYTFEQASLVLSNRSGAQQLEFQGISGEQRLESVTIGRLDTWDDLESLAWTGEVLRLRYSLRDKLLLNLLKPARLHLSRHDIGLEQACFELIEAGQTCIEADWTKAQELRVSAELNSVPLGPFVELMDTDIRLTQVLNGTIDWSHRLGQQPSGTVQLRLSPGLVERASDTGESARTGAGAFGFKLESGQLSRGHLRLPFPGLGDIALEFGIANLALDGTGQLSGKTRISIQDLSLLEVFVPGMENLAGQLKIDAQLGGVTADPHLNGTVVLEKGRLDIPVLGLTGLQVDLGGQVTRDDQLFLSGSLTSGSGTGALKAHLDIGQWDAPQFEFTINGENMTVMDVPSLMVKANPDLAIDWNAGGWSLNGRVLIPEARISPSDSGANQVNESSDVQIVAGQLPAGPEPRADRSVPLKGKVILTLGDQIKVVTPAVQMKATGEVEMAWQQALIPNANGQILLDGEVRTFGPRLRVDQGRVRFQDRPLDNPELEIRAEREVFGNTQIQAAGVRISGTARRPSVEAYTHPMTTEERAWTLLVTGSDFEYGQGVGAFDIGTYIAPRLYISYGISLFDDERMVSARYDLKKGFGVKATSSQNDNGVDISYTIER